MRGTERAGKRWPDTVAGITAAVLLCILPVVAQGQDKPVVRIAVSPFEGPRGENLRGQVVDSLLENEDVDIVSEADVRAAERRFRRRPPGVARDRAVARKLRLDGYVRGVVTPGDNWALTVVVVDAKDGAEVGSHVWSARNVRGLAIVGQTASLHLSDIIAKLAPRTAALWYDGKDEEEEAQAEEVADEADEAAPEGDVNADDSYDWLRITLLGGVLHRSLNADAVVLNNGRLPGSPVSEISEKRSYESAGVGHVEGGAEVMFFPGAIGNSQPFPYIGIVGRFRHSVFLSTGACAERDPVSAPCTQADRIDIATTQMELYGGLRGRYRLFGRGPRAFEVTLDGGIGVFSFVLDRKGLLEIERFSVVPPFSYSAVHTVLGASYGFTNEFRLLGSVGYHFGLGIGHDAREIWGVDSTGGSGIEAGLEARLDLSDWILDGLSVGLVGQYFTYQSKIAGQTACVNITACDDAKDRWEPWPSEAGDPNVVTGGIKDTVTDHYFRVSLAVGYAL